MFFFYYYYKLPSTSRGRKGSLGVGTEKVGDQELAGLRSSVLPLHAENLEDTWGRNSGFGKLCPWRHLTFPCSTDAQ